MTRIPTRFILMGIIMAFVGSVASAQETGQEWLALVDSAERVPYSYSEGSQTITTSSGSERTLAIRSWTAENGDLSLLAYTAPARVRGDKILIRDGGDNIWYYMRRRDVTRHFTGHTRRQKAMGSDFAYEDLATGDLTEDYTAIMLGKEKLDTVSCVKLRCIPTETGPSYDSIIVWASTADYLSQRIEYYDDDALLKTLYLSDFRIVDGRKLAMRMEMVNNREGSRTLMETDTITLSDEPDPVLFSKRSLSRLIPKK